MPLELVITRLGTALILGAIIGLERQWRSRNIGLRTNTLVTLGSAAMAMLGAEMPMNDPSAMVHILAGIISGVGFLGAGVIIQEGMTVKGCNTAATLWCSVAVGIFAGVGYITEAAILALFVALINLFLRPIVYCINAAKSDKEISE